MAYNIYKPSSEYSKNSKIGIVPTVQIPISPTDKYHVWNEGITLDTLSSIYYGSSIYGKFIMDANRQYGINEFEIPFGTLIRIPYPLPQADRLYYEQIQREINRNGK